ADMSPGLRADFTAVRRRLMPGLAQTKYAHAKASFDSKQYAEAHRELGEVLDMLADPDAAPAASQPPLSDLRTMATEFLELSARGTMIEPPPQPPAPGGSLASKPPPRIPVPGGIRIYSAADRDVVKPQPVQEALPAIAIPGPISGTAVFDVVVDERG